MKQTWKQITTMALIFALVLTPAAAFAHEGEEPDAEVTTYHSDENTRREYAQKLRERLDQKKADRMKAIEDKKAELRVRLDAKKQEICQKHQDRINRIIGNMGDRRMRASYRISEIQLAIQEFYTEKKLTVAGYDDLVAAADAAQAAAETSMKAQLQAPRLDCDGTQPRADMYDFREKRSASIDAMKEYRDAVKELGKAVREAVKNTEGN
jgi:hypothetical protein